MTSAQDVAGRGDQRAVALVRLPFPVGRRAVALDVLVALWVGAWIYLGVAIGDEVRGLRQVSGTVTRVGLAVQETGQVVSDLGSVPLLGDRVGSAADRIEQAGTSAVASGRRSATSARRLGWMLAVAIAVIPSVPLLAVYLPLRVAATRQHRRAGPDPRANQRR